MAPADASAAPVSAAPTAQAKDAPAAATAAPPSTDTAKPASTAQPPAPAEAPEAATEPPPTLTPPPAPSDKLPSDKLPSDQAPGAKVAETAPTSAAPHPYSADWLRQQAPGSYALQLLAGADREGSERFVQHHALTDKAAILETRRADKPWFIVVTGHYPDAAQAQAAVAELSPELRKAVQAWPRSVKALVALTH
jgi:DamX protein